MVVSKIFIIIGVVFDVIGMLLEIFRIIIDMVRNDFIIRVICLLNFGGNVKVRIEKVVIIR